MATEFDKLMQTTEGRTAFCIEKTIVNVTEHICELMEHNSISQADLASMIDVSPGRISQLLSGEANMTLRSVAKVLAAFGHVLDVSSKPTTAPTA